MLLQFSQIMLKYEQAKKFFLDEVKLHSSLKYNQIKKAIEFGSHKHNAQYRKGRSKDGEKIPYFNHCVNVAFSLLKEPDMDQDLIVASLLHDTVEDTETSYEELEMLFGDRVTFLVKGMTKIPPVKIKNSDHGLFGPLTRASEIDKRVWKIKLSDRADNLKTYLDIATKTKIKKYLRETQELLRYVRKANIDTPLIKEIETGLVSFFKVLEDNNI